uniref:Peroxisomal membrane protein MPV17 n=1 Tax=Araucaria cunninghamii TaxID=56994 RepID=A0A0D6QTJ8_ARACU
MMRSFASRFGRASPKWQERDYFLKQPTNFAISTRNFIVSSPSIPKTNSQVQSSLSIFLNSLRQNCRTFTQSRALRQSETSAAARSLPSTNGILRWYLEMVRKHPVLTKSVTASFILTAADITSQVITYAASDGLDASDKLEIDKQRTLRMTGYGFFLSGPTLHLWFNFMSKILPKTDIISTVKKMVLGQTIYGPVITVVFFSVNAFLQGESGSEILARLKRDLIPTFLSGVMYWPLCDFITYRYVPVHLQPLVSNSFSFIWTVYLTYMASLKKVNLEEPLPS